MEVPSDRKYVIDSTVSTMNHSLTIVVLTTLAFYWNKLDYHTKVLMPWKLMSEKPQPADRSLLLDYVSGNPAVVLSGAIRRRHVPVIASATGSLIIILVTVFSTGLFVLQPTLTHKGTMVSVLSTFDGSHFDASTVDSFPFVVVASILSGNMSIAYPPDTNMDYAVDTFGVQAILDGQSQRNFQEPQLMLSVGPNASKSGNVETFQADLNCRIGRVNLTSLGTDGFIWHIEADVMDEDCATGPTHIASARRGDDVDFIQFGKVIDQQCPGPNQRKLFVLYGQVEAGAPAVRVTQLGPSPVSGIAYSFNSTALICTPNHALQEALVTTDFAGTLIDVGVRKTLGRFVTSPWDLWSAFSTSVSAVAPTVLQVSPSNIGTYPYDEIFSALLSTWARQPAEYLDHETLLRDLRRLYATTANQIASRYLRANSTRLVPGSYQTTQLRVTLRDTAFRITEGGLTMLILCICLLLICSPCPSASRISATLASLAVMIQGTGQLRSHLCGSGSCSLGRIEHNLSGYMFTSHCHKLSRSSSIQLHQSKTTLATHSAPAAGVVAWWLPLAFSIYMKAAVIILPLVLVACLEASYQISRNGPGIDDAPLNQYWHYAWTWIPASTMTVVSLLYSSVTWSVALLEPYSILRTRSVAAHYALGRSILSKPSIELGYQGLRSKRYALLAAAASALLAPLLTIIVSGLIFVQPVQKTQGVVIPLTDNVYSPAGKVLGFKDWSSSSLWAANLLYRGYGGYPKGTYKNFVFPNPELDVRNTTLAAGAKLLNATYIDVNVDAIMANVTCRVMDPNGFRYTMDSMGLGYTTSRLILTHIDLAGLKCDESRNCIKQIAAMTLNSYPNSTRFSSQAFSDLTNSYTWMDPSAWPNGGTLRQANTACAQTNCVKPNVTLIYGTRDNTSARIHGIACYYNISQGRVNVTYDFSAYNVGSITSVRPSVQDFVTVSNYDQALPWQSQDFGNFEVVLPGGNLWQTALNNTPDAFYDTPTGSAQLATQISELYSHYFTQFYNTALRSHNFTTNPKSANATLYDENFQRLFQSALSTRILQALLLAMWLCACIIYWLLDTKDLLPKNPCSIAAQASLLADSKFLDMIPEGAENATLEELMQMTPFKDHLFSMGWWDDGMGGRRFGIDVGMADFDKGGDDEGKVEGDRESGSGIEEIGEGRNGKLDARVSVDIVGSRV
jgi:hypothetical protein